jgi:hypothetical protein
MNQNQTFQVARAVFAPPKELSVFDVELKPFQAHKVRVFAVGLKPRHGLAGRALEGPRELVRARALEPRAQGLLAHAGRAREDQRHQRAGVLGAVLSL